MAGVASARRRARNAGSTQAVRRRCAVARPDLGLVGLDQKVERSGIDIALFGQDRFERAHAQLGLGQFRMIVMMVVCHDRQHKRNDRAVSRYCNMGNQLLIRSCGRGRPTDGERWPLRVIGRRWGTGRSKIMQLENKKIAIFWLMNRVRTVRAGRSPRDKAKVCRRTARNRIT